MSLTQRQLEGMAPFLHLVNESYRNFQRAERQSRQLLDIQQKQKKHADLKIENFKRRAENAVNNIEEVVFEVDLDGRWIYLNPAWEKLTGKTVLDSLGRPFWEQLEDFDIEDYSRLTSFFKSADLSVCEVLKVTKNKEVYWFEVNVKKLFHFNGKPKVYIGTINDVSAQKRTELALMREKDRETLSNKAKDEFLSTISHEIRTPLNAVIGTTHLLLMEHPREEQMENLNVLKYASEHLLTLVNDILDFGKIDSGKITLENTSFHLDKRLHALKATYGNMAQENNIGFKINRDRNIPPILFGDPNRLTQILTNLIGNAIKFTPRGEVALNISMVSKKARSVKLCFEVVDTGIGISESQQEIIFDAFTQADANIGRKFGGSGLGLSISKKLVALMGGDIALTSEPGVGSVFFFNLELALPPKDVKLKLTEDGKEGCPKSLEGIKVLIAEDNKVNILMLKKFLSKWRITSHFVENGADAVAACKENDYDLILMDILMPVMNGFEATTAIRAFDKDTPIVALSASSAAHIREEYEEGGFDAHLGKPFNPNSLFDIMKQLHENKGQNTPHDLGLF
ncbi:ATP-binding protein [Maribacter sp. 2307ULW6-5]|uniref:PAS domain-containing hybrid sensor histidine kinase/response regulator n=1 Tax=Maribacter sp. 2307ULW6-5 TaxID=3386275 RepID=UPI0039BC3788